MFPAPSRPIADLAGPDAGRSSAAPGPARASHAVRHPVGRAVLPLALVGVVSLVPVFGERPSGGAAHAVLAVLAGLTLIAVATGGAGSARLGLALTATVAAFALPWQLDWWPLPGALGAGVYLLAGALAPDRSRAAVWPRGRLTRTGLAAMLAIALVATAALLAFHELTPAGLQFGADLLTGLPRWALVGVGLAFAAGNAAVEEFLYRGVIQHHLTRVLGIWPAIVLQALAFGLLHLHGYPFGPVGVALTAAYGLMLGVLRLKTGGLLAPWITHTLADAVIFVFIVQAIA